jgi:hypothetical protein
MNTTQIFGIGIFISLLLSISLAGAYLGGYMQGEEGNQGIIGPVGPQGEKGISGNSPEYEWNETCIRFMNPDGTWGEWIDLLGPEGPQGNTGPRGATGASGSDGEDGEDGIDLEPNEAPIITFNTSESYVEGCRWNDDFWFILNFSVEDPESDYMEVRLWYKYDDPLDDWNYCDIWPYEQNNTFRFTKEFNGNHYWGNYSIEWLIQVQDGENLVYQPVPVTLKKEICS